MKLKSNILKMLIHSLFLPTSLVVSALAYRIYAHMFDRTLFSALLIVASFFFIINIRFIITFILVLIDIFFRKTAECEININQVTENKDIIGFGPKNPTLFDIFSHDRLILCSFYCINSIQIMKLKYYGNKNDFDEKLQKFFANISYAKYRKYHKTRFILKNPGIHKIFAKYYKNSKIIKEISELE